MFKGQLAEKILNVWWEFYWFYSLLYIDIKIYRTNDNPVRMLLNSFFCIFIIILII